MAENECKGSAKVLLPMAPISSYSPENENIITSPPRINQTFVDGIWQGAFGKIPRVSSSLKWSDQWGTIKARWGVGRMSYMIDPGLYALGQPDKDAPVLVTANYKMSFDKLREALPGRNAWILVLDTKGINVWCSAGKGTFGTDELVLRISLSGLKDIVKHRDLILPQLGAPGVSAHLVKHLSGFTVHYGPIMAKDLPAYLDAGMKATPEMRRKTFLLKERVALIPIELIASMKASLIALPIMLLFIGFSRHGGFIQNIKMDGIFSIVAIFVSIAAGTVLTPILLPYLPGKAFSTKGFTMGIFLALMLLYSWGYDLRSARGLLGAGAWIMMMSAVAAYLAMNFTGSSTYTSLSGVKKEMRWALPIEICTGLSGFAVWLASRFIV